MAQPTPTNAVAIFVKMVEAARRRVQMVPRSAGDKEFFAQDWFAARLQEANVEYEQQGRNSYPDFLVASPAPAEGYEVKSLRFAKGRPARKDIDFNSTIPSGEKDDQSVFLVFFLYEGTGSNPRSVHSISLAHADLINSDHVVADEHVNVAVHDFGSYGDGFIRNRKMYVFPHPITIDEAGLARCRLIVPVEWNIEHPQLKKAGTITRTVAPEAVDSYTIKLYGRGQAEVSKVAYPNAGRVLEFGVFEMKTRQDGSRGLTS